MSLPKRCFDTSRARRMGSSVEARTDRAMSRVPTRKANARRTLRMAPARAYLLQPDRQAQASLEILGANGGQIQLRLTGQVGARYQVMRSPDLTNSIDHTMVEVGREGEVIIVEGISEVTRLFYRIH